MKSVTSATVGKFMGDHVDMAGSELHTDESSVYTPLGRQFIAHRTVVHSKKEYMRDGATSNAAEGFFSQLKRSLDHNQHHVSKTHLHRYVAEFDFRYSTCKMDDSARLQTMIDRADGRRLTYKPLTEKG